MGTLIARKFVAFLRYHETRVITKGTKKSVWSNINYKKNSTNCYYNTILLCYSCNFVKQNFVFKRCTFLPQLWVFFSDIVVSQRNWFISRSSTYLLSFLIYSGSGSRIVVTTLHDHIKKNLDYPALPLPIKCWKILQKITAERQLAKSEIVPWWNFRIIAFVNRALRS